MGPSKSVLDGGVFLAKTARQENTRRPATHPEPNCRWESLASTELDGAVPFLRSRPPIWINECPKAPKIRRFDGSKTPRLWSPSCAKVTGSTLVWNIEKTNTHASRANPITRPCGLLVKSPNASEETSAMALWPTSMSSEWNLPKGITFSSPSDRFCQTLPTRNPRFFGQPTIGAANCGAKSQVRSLASRFRTCSFEYCLVHAYLIDESQAAKREPFLLRSSTKKFMRGPAIDSRSQ